MKDRRSNHPPPPDNDSAEGAVTETQAQAEIQALRAKADALSVTGPPSPERAMNTMRKAVAKNDAAILEGRLADSPEMAAPETGENDADRRELYRSPNGDCWSIGRDPSSGYAIVIYEPHRPSGAHTSCIGLAEFLGRGHGPEQQALLRLIGTLVAVPSFGA